MRFIVVPLHDMRKCRVEGWRTRDAHLVEHLLRRPDVERVLVVDRPMTVPEMVATRRFGFANIGAVAAGSVRHRVFVRDKLVVLDYLGTGILRPAVLGKRWFPRAYEDPAFQRVLRATIAAFGFDRAILFLMSPHAASLIGINDAPAVAFDCDDNLLVHPEISRRRKRGIARSMRRISERADVFFANSEETRHFYRGWCRRTEPVWVSNGADPERFAASVGSPPPDLAGLPRPILGYGGMLGRRIDTALLARLAREFPEGSVVLVGPVINRRWMRSLLADPRIHYLGDKHYGDYPRYVRGFDVALIPHNVGVFENGGDPTKLYEYLAAGRPVVSTRIAGVERYADRIVIADDHDRFVDGVGSAVARREAERGAGAADSRLREEDTWAHKVDLMMRRIRGVVGEG